MPWSKIDDAILDHDKVEHAAARLNAKGGQLQVLGAVVFAIVYCNRKLTDGTVPDRALTAAGVSLPLRRALVDVQLWHEADGGITVHDYLDYNESASQIKARRSRDRERKRSREGFPSSNGIPDGFQPDSTRNPLGFHQDSHGSSSRAVPVPSRPVPVPPNPHARRRAAEPPAAPWRDRCPHTPSCPTPEACRLLTARAT
jgi:hypothetical protein